MIVNHSRIVPVNRDYLKSRGVPANLFTVGFNVDEYLTKVEYKTQVGGLKVIRPNQQLQMLEQTIKDPYHRPYLYVIAASTREVRAQSVALTVFRRAIAVYFEERDRIINAPYWWSVYGGRFDKLRDSDSHQQMIGHISLLVIDNVAINSTQEKIEKVRDLIQIYSEIPRILVVSGTDPMKFCLETLFMRPNKLAFLGERHTAI